MTDPRPLSESTSALETANADLQRATEALRKRAQEAALLAAVGTGLTRGGSLREVLQACAQAMVDHLDAAFARIWTLDDAAQMLELRASAGLYTHLDGPHGRVPVGALKIGKVASERTPHLTNDVPDDPRVSDKDWARREGMVAFAGYPLIVDGRTMGVMAMFARKPLSDATLGALGTVADGIALAIERTRAAEAVRHQTERLRALADAALAIQAAASHDAVLQTVNEQARAVIGAHQSVTSLTRGPDWSQAITAVSLSDKYARWRTYDELPDGSGIYHLVAQMSHPFRLTQAELEAHPAWKGFGRHAGEHPPMRGWLAVPLIGRDGHNIGLIQLSDRYEGEFTVEDEAILVQFAQMASAAAENSRLYGDAVAARAQAEREAAEREMQAEELEVQAEELEAQAEELQAARTDLEQANAKLRQSVTESAAAKEKAEQAQRAAEEANNAKSAFLATMSHELRTPLNAIQGYAQLLEMGISGSLSEAQTAQLERIQFSSRHLLGLINDILDLAKVESGQLEVARQPLRVGASVWEALAVVEPQASQRGIRIENTTREESVVGVGDEDRVRQILVNLLSNAVKFTEPGGRVRISCAVADGPDTGTELTGAGPWLRIDVDDTGIGIPPDRLRSVFEPFVQVDSQLTRAQGGTGLGLTISRRLARLMDGDLTVRSAHGEGSCFTLWLPAGSGADPGEQARVVEPELTPGLIAVGHTITNNAEEIVRSYADRLQEDPAIPGATEADRIQLEDHTATFLVNLGKYLVALSTENHETALMQDATEIQRVIMERQGAQRLRLGWDEAAIRRAYQILWTETERTIRRDAFLPAAEMDEAIETFRRLLDHAEGVTLRGFRAALEGSAG